MPHPGSAIAGVYRRDFFPFLWPFSVSPYCMLARLNNHLKTPVLVRFGNPKAAAHVPVRPSIQCCMVTVKCYNNNALSNCRAACSPNLLYSLYNCHRSTNGNFMCIYRSSQEMYTLLEYYILSRIHILIKFIGK